jgi:hypothetical protein
LHMHRTMWPLFLSDGVTSPRPLEAARN